MVKLADEVRIIDADSHMTERHDLFTERAPKGYEDRVPHVIEIDGKPVGHREGRPLGPARGGGVIDRDGNKLPFEESQASGASTGSTRPRGTRSRGCELMDESASTPRCSTRTRSASAARTSPTPRRRPGRCACCASSSTTTRWPRCRRSRTTGFLPMPIMPAWSIDDCVREAKRCAALGYRGVNMTSRSRRTPARPTSPTGPGTRCGRCAPTCSCRCTSTSAPARRR